MPLQRLTELEEKYQKLLEETIPTMQAEIEHLRAQLDDFGKAPWRKNGGAKFEDDDILIPQADTGTAALADAPRLIKDDADEGRRKKAFTTRAHQGLFEDEQ